MDPMNAFIRGSRRGHNPPREPRPDPERDARLVAVLEELGEPIPDYLRPAPPSEWGRPASDWGQGPRGIPLRPEGLSVNTWIRDVAARLKGLRD
jgi:hypothetical protein